MRMHANSSKFASFVASCPVVSVGDVYPMYGVGSIENLVIYVRFFYFIWTSFGQRINNIEGASFSPQEQSMGIFLLQDCTECANRHGSQDCQRETVA